MGHNVVGVKVPGPFSSKVSVRWSDGSLGRIKFGPAIELVGTGRIQDALDHPGMWIVVGQLEKALLRGIEADWDYSSEKAGT